MTGRIARLSPMHVMRMRAGVALLLWGGLLCTFAGCVRVNVHGAPPSLPTPAAEAATLRVATYNTSLNDDAPGGMIQRLQQGDDGARKVAAVLQQVRPDIVLLNEFDYDAAGQGADLFQRDYLAVAQVGGGAALAYPYRYFAPVNTGVPSGLDLDGNGVVGGTDRLRGNDAWGYGLHPGQYGMLVLSRYPIDANAVRTFQLLKWSAMPGARGPVDPKTGKAFYPAATWAQLRLSSKSHWDVPIATPLGTLHFLVSHPTPPAFDGPERRNVARNGDEIRFWSHYLSPQPQPWQCDDAGTCGGLAASARFVIAGDLNNDPVDGSGDHAAIVELVEDPRVARFATPRSAGGAEAALLGGGNIGQQGSPAQDTGNFGPKVGNLHIDYVLPSVGFSVRGSGVFWPTADTAHADIVTGSDHRLVWVDLGR